MVSHTHWDREWYRTFQAFRARLVDTIDVVLELLDSDPGFRFLLDGQTIVLEDYLEIRPARRSEIERAVASGRLAIGPWYVQPDSLLPGGETHVRNLLEGRRVGAAFGEVSRVAYTPDSFGHPAQFPALFRGFGLEPFVYWRGNDREIDELPAEYLWEAPDGSAILVHHLWEGYFSATGLAPDPEHAADTLEQLGRTLAARSRSGRVLFMNGIDHALPQRHTAAVAEALARRTGWVVHRAVLDDFAAGLSRDVPRFRGELVGGRVANLLPGVWSTRTPLKLRNRAVETALTAWAEPWSALGRQFGTPDEQPSLRAAWRALLPNQAHDSICGCSQDRVHEQMQTRFDTAEELARETTARVLERLAGLGAERRTPWTDDIDLAVFNPSPHARTDLVRVPLESNQWFEIRGGPNGETALHPVMMANISAAGFTADGEPVTLLEDPSPSRMRLIPERPPLALELIARDVPAYGWRRICVRRSDAHPDREDAGTTIASEDWSLTVAADGTFRLRAGAHEFANLCGLEDLGDRGDTYDFDPVGDSTWVLENLEVRRRLHASGVQSLTVLRQVRIPAELAPSRKQRSNETVLIPIEITARLIPGVPRVDLRVRVDNRAKDHRLRLLFPTGAAADTFRAATTFDVSERHTAPRDATKWVHRAPSTIAHQGFVAANRLCVAAPGLPEAEVTPAGVIAVTLVRSVGWLSRLDLESRPQVAGPALPTPGAQCLGTIEAQLALFVDTDPRAILDAETGLRAVIAGPNPLIPPDRSLLEIEPRAVVLSALKPAESGQRTVLRLLNPTDQPAETVIHLGFPVSNARTVRLDETPDDGTVWLKGRTMSLTIPAHSLRTILLTP